LLPVTKVYYRAEKVIVICIVHLRDINV